MKRELLVWFIVWFIVLLICPIHLVAADLGDTKPDNPILVEPEQLQKRLSDKNLRVLDVRSHDEYVKAHVPGAIRVDIGDWKSLALAEDGLHDAKGWGAKVGSLGITGESRVVLYGSKVSDTARIWWLLKYVGVKNASLLNGGWQWWTKKDRPVEQSTPQPNATKFRPEFQADRLAEIDSVKKSLKSETVKVVDTRSDREFSAGRIPQSVHLEWTHLLAADGRFKTPTQLKELFHEQGILPDETAVCY